MLCLSRFSRIFFKRPALTKKLIRTNTSEKVQQIPALFPARSWLISTKTREGIMKASQSKADVIFLDLEDSVAQDMKARMLQEYVSVLKDGLFQGKRVFVRLCELENEELAKQVEVLTKTDGVYGFILPKINGPSCLKEYEKLVQSAEEESNLPLGSIKFALTLETLDGYFNAKRIVNGCDRNVGVIAGAVDFEAEAYCEASSSTCEAYFSQVALASRAAGILPISGVWDKIDDHVGAENFYRKMKACGFAGAITLTPSQSTQANIAFSYSPKEIQWAEKVSSKERSPVVQPSIQESRQMIGFPHRLIASRICEENQYIQDTTPAPDEPSLLIRGRMPHRGLRDVVQIGQTLRSPLEITVTESWKTLWDSAFLTFNRLNTSNEFASRLGLSSAPLPFALTNALTLALTVTSFSEPAMVHLGCYDAVQKKPVFPGDTFSCVSRIDDAKTLMTKGEEQNTVVHSSHHLVNQKKENVFSVKQRTMFPPLKIENQRQADGDGILDVANEEDSWKQFITSQSTACLSPTPAHAQPSLTAGELIIHDDYKCFGVTETRMLCKLFRATNAIHYNIIRYSPSDILVPGPFVVAAMISNAEYDLGDVVYEECPINKNINKVNPGDQIGTLTFVRSIRQLPENEDLEEITLHQIGVKNVDMEWLVNSGVPEKLFGEELKKPAEFEELCAVHCPILYRKIACQAVRKIVRVCPKAGVP